jgi:predicted nucleotidyltransferase
MNPGMNDQNPPANETSGKTSNLSETLLQTIVAEIDSDDVIAIILGGSYARGEATAYSDVDFARLVRTPPQGKKKRYFYRDGRLISFVTWTLGFIEESTTKPELAIWRVPGLRQARILLDKEGLFEAFQRSLIDFRWSTLRAKADTWASDHLMLYAEFVHKALGTLLDKNTQALAYATEELLYALTEALAVQRGVLIQRGNSYYSQVQEAAGLDSAWTRYHRMLLCLEPLPAHLSLSVASAGGNRVPALSASPRTLAPVEARGIAALRLYQETVRLLHAALQPEDRDVIDQAIQVIEQAQLSALL